MSNGYIKKAVEKQLHSKTKPLKFLNARILLIGIDVYHEMNFSRACAVSFFYQKNKEGEQFVQYMDSKKDKLGSKKGKEILDAE